MLWWSATQGGASLALGWFTPGLRPEIPEKSNASDNSPRTSSSNSLRSSKAIRTKATHFSAFAATVFGCVTDTPARDIITP